MGIKLYEQEAEIPDGSPNALDDVRDDGGVGDVVEEWLNSGSKEEPVYKSEAEEISDRLTPLLLEGYSLNELLIKDRETVDRLLNVSCPLIATVAEPFANNPFITHYSEGAFDPVIDSESRREVFQNEEYGRMYGEVLKIYGLLNAILENDPFLAEPVSRLSQYDQAFYDTYCDVHNGLTDLLYDGGRLPEMIMGGESEDTFYKFMESLAENGEYEMHGQLVQFLINELHMRWRDVRSANIGKYQHMESPYPWQVGCIMDLLHRSASVACKQEDVLKLGAILDGYRSSGISVEEAFDVA
jgi:hypothetical protein